MIFAFDLDLCSVTVISGLWTEKGHPVLPAVISVPDHGEVQVRCLEHPGLEGTWQGSRSAKYADFILEMPAPESSGVTLEFLPVQLPAPAGLADTCQWSAVRRGWCNFLQVHAECGRERADKESPAGVWTNNVISNPVSSVLFLLADHVLLLPELAPGISLTPLLRRTVEYWITLEIAPDGRIYYFENGEWVWPVMDSNPAVLIGAWAYAEASGDDRWLEENITRLEHVAGYIRQQDTDKDGLIESEQTGNSGSHKRPDSGWDTFGRWLNGGCCVSNTSWFLMGGYASGRKERADRILDAMIRRQEEGVFPNGGGFQNGVVDMMPFGAEFFEWDGKPSGYEGHLVYSWSFLQCVLLREPGFLKRILRPIEQVQQG